MTECYDGCPDCRCKVDEAAPVPSTGGSTKATGAACSCYPANAECPSGVTCDEELWTVSPGHVQLESGMVRSDPTGKPDYTLIDLDLLERWAVHMTKNVASKGHNNWRLAHTDEDRQRFLASFWRHAIAWTRGETDEDHAAAILFNVAGVEHVSRQLD